MDPNKAELLLVVGYGITLAGFAFWHGFYLIFALTSLAALCCLLLND